MKNAVFWNVTPCGSCKNRRFGGTYLLHYHVENISSQLASIASYCQSCFHLVDSLQINDEGDVPAKRRFLQEAHGVTSQKRPFFAVACQSTCVLTDKSAAQSQ
jgi:hypothetical protein